MSRVLAGRECAALLRGWIARDTGGRMPPEGVEMILEGIRWLESDEPVANEAALYREYVGKVARPMRLLTLGRLLGEKRGGTARVR